MFEGVIQDLVDQLGRLPGIGPKGAQRIAFHLLSVDPQEAQQLAEAITTVKEKISFCTICGYISTEEECSICRDPRRIDTVLCIVEEAKDVVAVERTGEFRGRYHVLGGAIDPMRNVGPNDLRVRELVKRLADETITEIILATDNNIEGEATAAYISRLLSQMDIRITRLASGLPAGAELDFADEITLGRAFSGRQLLHADS